MKLLFACCLLLLTAGSAIAQSFSATEVLSQGTEIDLKMAQTLTSKNAHIGDRVELVVADDVIVYDAVLIPRNTRVLGTVSVGKATEGDKKNPHEVTIQIDYIRLGERRIMLRGRQSDRGKIDKGMAIASTVLFGATGLAIVMDARTGEIREGKEVRAFVAEDVTLPVLGVAQKSAEEPVQTPASR